MVDEVVTERRALDLSRAFVQAGLRLSAIVDYAGLREHTLSHATGVSIADFRTVFGDLEAYVHVLQQHLTEELSASMRAALAAGGGKRERLLRAANAFLDLSLARRGAHAWVAELCRRSLPLQASREKHWQQLARLLQPLMRPRPPPVMEAEARLLMAALREAARNESAAGTADEQLRLAVSCYVSTCTSPS